MPRRFGFGLGFNINRLTGLPEPSGFVAKYQAYDVNDFTLVTGSNVSQWDDISANANHLTQGTSTNQPVLTQDANQFNNTVNFDTDDYMEGLPSQSGDFTYVFKDIDYDNTATIVKFLANNAGSSRFYFQDTSGGQWVFRSSDGTFFTLTTPIQKYSSLILTKEGDNISFYGDATLIGSVSGATGKESDCFRLGNTPDSINGSLKELYVYDRALTQDEINWFSYLRNDQNEILRPPLLPS